jgi:hypothetical protein
VAAADRNSLNAGIEADDIGGLVLAIRRTIAEAAILTLAPTTRAACRGHRACVVIRRSDIDVVA